MIRGQEAMARYVLKLPALPQMDYYQEGAPGSVPFRTIQVRKNSTRSLRSMGSGGSCEGRAAGSENETEPGEGAGGGCLEGLRGRRGARRRGRQGGTQPLEAGLTLQHDAIRFTPAQLARAEAVLVDIVRDDLPTPDAIPVAPGVEAVSERLVQRLLCSVGSMDSRFSCKYLVCLDRRPSGDSDGLTLEYLVRLDVLSSPALYPGEPSSGPPCRVVEGAAQEAVPQGYARLRIQGPGADQWAGLLSPAGFLRRDKVQERFVELLATAAAPISSPGAQSASGRQRERGPMPAPRGPRGPHSPLQVDESRLCGAPGKVVDAAILPDLLALPADGQLYLATGTDRYPDPRDARIAIVEGSPWVRLRLGLSRDVLIKLVLGVGVERWPRGSDLPARVPLNHPDCLLYQHAATTGCFLVASAPPPQTRCDDRPCTWQVWAPCCVAVLLQHYGPRSAVVRSLRALEAVRRALALRCVSRHALRSLLLWRLERERPAPQTMTDWAPGSTPLHVIAVLDRLVSVLRGASERCYLFPALHVLAASARQGQPVGEDALYGDANALAGFLRRLHADCSAAPGPGPGLSTTTRRASLGSLNWPGEEDSRRDCWSRLEEVLLPAWAAALRDTAPPAATRSRRLGFRLSGGSGGSAAEAAQFTPRQLLYIGALLRGLLLCRSLRIEGPSSHSWFPGTMRRHPLASPPGTPQLIGSSLSDDTREVTSEGDSTTADAEDVACLVAVVLDQARAFALAQRRGSERASRSRAGSPVRRASSSASSGSAKPKRRSSRRSRSKRSDSVFRRRYDSAMDLLLEAIRVDPGVVVPADDSALVRCVLRWLVLSADRAPRALAGPLRRFLRALAGAAHHCAPLHALWAASRARARDELAAIGAFCRLVDSSRVQPLHGMVEAADKGWEWARWMLRLSARLPGGVHAVMAPSPGRVLRFSLPGDTLPPRWLGSHSHSTSPSNSSTPHATMTPSVARVYRAALAAGATNGMPTDVVLDREPHAGCDMDAEDGWEPLHGRLRQASPLTALLLQRHRMGLHRAIGDLLPALLALRKFTVIQEAAWSLPEPYRSEALDGVARIARETRRRSAARSRITPTHSLSRNGEARGTREGEQYRLTSEMSREASLNPEEREHVLSEADQRLEQELRRMKVADSLLGTCRVARASPQSVDISAMFDDPVVSPVYPAMPSAGPQQEEGNRFSFLELTHDKQLRLGPGPAAGAGAGRREALTKL